MAAADYLFRYGQRFEKQKTSTGKSRSSIKGGGETIG
jgi:hypothetical protein